MLLSCDGTRAAGFLVLGPLEVVAGTAPVALGGTKARALLALLLLHANQTVSARAPDRRALGRAAAKRGRGGAPGLRFEAEESTRFGDAGHAPHGYALLVDPERLDAVRFERLAAEGARLLAVGDAHAAGSALREALALWRGPLLADLAHEPFVQSEARRLDELRLASLEARVEADLALGRHQDVVAELERLVPEHPFRERLRAQLMLALYRCGRQSDALEHYRRTAELFAEELGIEPGPELKAREHAILNHDPSLRLTPLAEPICPRLRTPSLGRERELEEVAALLSQPETRLVTLTGTGGSGKTRLAVEVAARLQRERRRAGVLRGSGAARRPAARACSDRGHGRRRGNGGRAPPSHTPGLPPAPAAPSSSWTTSSTSSTPAPTSPRSSPTSPASRCSPRAEARCKSGPSGATRSGRFATRTPALFVERARAIRRGFEPTSAVEALCRRLDRLPLAIELAAARTDLFTPESILARLDERFDLLSRAPATCLLVSARCGRLSTGAINSSADQERELFARLAVFAGGCELEAAEQVCGATPESVASLTGASLVRRDHDRILMLETIREYALERLAASSDEDVVRRSHAEYFLRLAQRSMLDVAASKRLSPADLSVEDDNLREALGWSREADAVDVHLRMVAALAVFWDRSGRLREGDEWLRGAVAVAKRDAPTLRGSVLLGASQIAGRLRRARARPKVG